MGALTPGDAMASGSGSSTPASAASHSCRSTMVGAPPTAPLIQPSSILIPTARYGTTVRLVIGPTIPAVPVIAVGLVVRAILPAAALQAEAALIGHRLHHQRQRRAWILPVEWAGRLG